ncbi:unnamed protein product [marine sediment metagenome]|uniref:Uncharacterized protein n=1 Tax=marine sediment metagenome TaxID=412755 RepID=X1A2T0_9ZZZZ
MVDKKTIGISSLITLGIVVLALIVPGFFDTPKYYCEAESSIMECPGDLSGGLGTRCYLNVEKNSWDYCKSGWIEITNDLIIQEEPTPEPEPTPASVGGTKWLCSPVECKRIE